MTETQTRRMEQCHHQWGPWTFTTSQGKELTIDEGLKCTMCDATIHDREMAARLLQDQVLSLWDTDSGYSLHVDCSDIFMWACADAEDLHSGDLHELFQIYAEYGPRWAGAMYCITKRDCPPQGPVERDMRKEGAWNEGLEAIKKKFVGANPHMPDCGNPSCKGCESMVDSEDAPATGWPASKEDGA